MKKYMKIAMILSSLAYSTAPLFSGETVQTQLIKEDKSLLHSMNERFNTIIDETKKVLSNGWNDWLKVPVPIRTMVYMAITFPVVFGFSVKYVLANKNTEEATIKLINGALNDPNTQKEFVAFLKRALQNEELQASAAQAAIDTLNKPIVQATLNNQTNTLVATAVEGFSWKSLFWAAPKSTTL